MLRNAWLRAAARLADNPRVQVNAARFLHPEHPEEAEELLERKLAPDAAKHPIAANLGFLYALDILGLSHPEGEGREAADAQRVGARARAELDRSNHPIVLAAAGTALPNLFMRTPGSRSPNPDRTAFDLGSALQARARQLAPDEPELKGPMPVIREFQTFAGNGGRAMADTPAGQTGMVGSGTLSSAPPPGSIRVGGNVHTAKLIENPAPVYPPLAAQARIQGTVRFNVIISPEGNVVDVSLVSGHPLLIQSATEVIRRYRYQPTLLNGTPTAVVTQVDVPFLLSPPQ